MLFGSFLHFSVQCSRIFPAEYSCDRFVFVYYPECYSGLSYIFRLSTRRFPRRVISHPYCYVHYDVLDTTCVIGCLMNDILILFLCLLSRMLFGVFLISFSLVFSSISPASILVIAMCLFISSNIIRGILIFWL